MAIPAIQQRKIGTYILKNMITGNMKFPLVLMLEPLFLCNLKCKGCGKISHPEEVLKKQLSVDECVHAADECGAPIVSIAGGEPLLYKDMPELVQRLTAKEKFVYLCTNALLVEKRIDEFTPSPFLTFNVHIDGPKDIHDDIVGRPGTFDRAVAAIRMLLERGFRVTTNTTFFNQQTPEEAAKLLDYLSALGVEGLTISAGFSYESASDQDGFLGEEHTKNLFRNIFRLGKEKRPRKWQFNHSSLYLDFLAGNQNFKCTPWGNPCRNIFGWQTPCYLLDDGTFPTYKDLMEKTPWEKYGKGNDPRCNDCMVHCGFEPTAVVQTILSPLKALKVAIRGVNTD